MEALSRQSRRDSKILADIEKACHFLERRSDAASGLQSGWCRHSGQAAEARTALAKKALSVILEPQRFLFLSEHRRFALALLHKFSRRTQSASSRP